MVEPLAVVILCIYLAMLPEDLHTDTYVVGVGRLAWAISWYYLGRGHGTSTRTGIGALRKQGSM